MFLLLPPTLLASGLIKRIANCCTCEDIVRRYRPVLPYLEIELNRIV
jgi:hypothetical protein